MVHNFVTKELQNNVKIVLFGKKNNILKELKYHNFSVNNFDIVDCSEKIEMGEHVAKTKTKINSEYFCWISLFI